MDQNERDLFQLGRTSISIQTLTDGVTRVAAGYDSDAGTDRWYTSSHGTDVALSLADSRRDTGRD